MIINQIKNLIEDIENDIDKDDLYLKHTELVKLILENLPICNSETIQQMRDDDILSDIFYEMSESSKILTNFIKTNIDFIESDMKGSDFELEVKESSSTLEALKQEFSYKNEKYLELQKIQEEIMPIQAEISSLESEISQFDNIDIEQLRLEREELAQRLKIFEKEKGEMLKKHKRHIEIDKNIDISTKTIEDMFSDIDSKIEEIEREYKKIIMESDI